MHTENINVSTRNGTVCGTLLVMLLQVNWASLLNTVLIAAVGAATSFTVSVALGYLQRRFSRKRP